MPIEVAERAEGIRARWDAIQVVVDRNVCDLAAGRYALIHEVVSWFKTISMFRELAEECLIARKPPALSKRCHNTTLAMLIAEGERLLSDLDRSGGLPKNSRISREDVEATVEELLDTQRGWYGTMSEARRKQILEGILGASQRPSN